MNNRQLREEPEGEKEESIVGTDPGRTAGLTGWSAMLAVSFSVVSTSISDDMFNFSNETSLGEISSLQEPRKRAAMRSLVAAKSTEQQQ